MKVIAKPRGAGKTWDAIELAKKDYSYIVCKDIREVERVWKLILDGKHNLPMPITWKEFVNGQFHVGGISGFVVDNLDLCIQASSPVPIKGITVTVSVDPERKTK